tara:strand:- start:122 stop:919 length:798 start_codon:yes stop_codon:yes gene_type:complete
MIKRDQLIGEFFLRKHIQKVINEVYEVHKSKKRAEDRLRTIIRNLISEAYTLREVGLSIDVEEDYVLQSDEEKREKEAELKKMSDEEKAVKSGMESEEIEDRTGINFAVDTVKNLGTQILSKYNMLDHETDKQYFYDWLFINTLLLLHGKEKELNPNNPDEAFPSEFLSVIEKYSKKVNADEQVVDQPGERPLEHPTGITTLGKVWPEIEKGVGDSYISLTTDVSHRHHFTKALINGFRNLLDPQRVLRVIEKEVSDKPTAEIPT